MRLKFWKKTLKKVKKTTLRIVTSYGVKGLVKPQQENIGHLESWRGFYKWYFCRPQSDYFVLRYKSGHEIVMRKHILSFSIESSIVEEEE